MNALVAIIQREGKPAVSTREFYVAIGGTDLNFNRWFKANVLSNQFAVADEDYTPLHRASNSEDEGLTGGRPADDFAFTIPFAKKLAMMARTSQGERVRDYFIDCERRALAAPVPTLDFSDPLVVAQLFIKAESERRAVVEKNNRLALAVSELQPKAAFADAVRFGEADMNIGTFAKIIRVKHLFEWLREHRYIYRRDRHNVPFDQFGENGQRLFAVKMVPKAGRMYPVTSITGKGQLRIALELGVGVQPTLALAGGKLEPTTGVNPQQQKTG